MDCFAEPVIGRRFAPTRWLAMTEAEIGWWTYPRFAKTTSVIPECATWHRPQMCNCTSGNPYSRWWLWIPGSLVSLAPRNDDRLNLITRSSKMVSVKRVQAHPVPPSAAARVDAIDWGQAPGEP